MAHAHKIGRHVGALAINTPDGLQVNGVIIPDHIPITFPFDENRTDSNVFISLNSYQIMSVAEVHAKAGTDEAPVMAMITKCTKKESPDRGKPIIKTPFDLKKEANAIVEGVLSETASNLQLDVGDRICLTFSGVLTAVEGGNITIVLQRV